MSVWVWGLVHGLDTCVTMTEKLKTTCALATTAVPLIMTHHLGTVSGTCMRKILALEFWKKSAT